MKKTVFALASLLAFVLSACGSGVNEITIVEKEFSFTPSSITVKAGEPVRLTLQNQGAVEHDFVVEQVSISNMNVVQGNAHDHGSGTTYDLHVSTDPERESIIEFTVTEPGTYRIFCSVAGHVEGGMVGELIVVVE